MSLLETFMFPAMLLPTKPAVFIVKQALMKTPYMKSILAVRNAIAIGRQNPREDLRTIMTEGVRYLKEGTSVCVFPQSTRSTDFDASSFNTIGTKLAERSGTAVMPVAVKTDFLGCGRLVKDFGPVDPAKELHVCFGEPIPVTRANAKEAHAQTVDFIRSHLSAWGVPCK
jgi:1-acyl-sn-glycerol-3-phosphate acyltransferase